MKIKIFLRKLSVSSPCPVITNNLIHRRNKICWIGTLLVLFVISLTLISSRSIAWDSELNNTNSEYYNVMNKLKNNQTNITNESELTPEQKESLRIRNNLEIAKLTNTLTKNQSEQLEKIEKEEYKLSREENKELFIYILIGIFFVVFIFWMSNIND